MRDPDGVPCTHTWVLVGRTVVSTDLMSGKQTIPERPVKVCQLCGDTSHGTSQTKGPQAEEVLPVVEQVQSLP